LLRRSANRPVFHSSPSPNFVAFREDLRLHTPIIIFFRDCACVRTIEPGRRRPRPGYVFSRTTNESEANVPDSRVQFLPQAGPGRQFPTIPDDPPSGILPNFDIEGLTFDIEGRTFESGFDILLLRYRRCNLGYQRSKNDLRYRV
jgi:hypothetical protein